MVKISIARDREQEIQAHHDKKCSAGKGEI